jgi:hypothetical protein
MPFLVAAIVAWLLFAAFFHWIGKEDRMTWGQAISISSIFLGGLVAYTVMHFTSPGSTLAFAEECLGGIVGLGWLVLVPTAILELRRRRRNETLRAKTVQETIAAVGLLPNSKPAPLVALPSLEEHRSV